MLRPALKQRPVALIAQLFSALLPLAAGLLATPAAHAQAVPGNTGVVTVLADGLKNPTTVAVKNRVAFVPEGQLARLGALGGLFQARPISLEGAGVLRDKALRTLLPGNDFFPEGIALDPATNDLFVGSIFNGIIVKVPDGQRQQQFTGRIGTGVLTRGALGLRVDNARNLLWACDSSLAVAGGTVTGIDLTSRQPVVTHELPAGSLCNDIILDAAGDLLVTETLVGQVFRIDAANALTPNSAQLFLATQEIAPPAAGQLGANGLAIAGGILFVSNTFAGTLVRFDLNAADVAGSVQLVNLTENNVASAILSGPDGVLPLSDTQLLVVENGFAGAGNNRLVRVDLDAL
jgi:sugar lactone lactonase YvrE